ncbi:hypothetical protein D6C95_01452 [Aureobasidium pullulans]|nr:hypothetical protein D6C95_01452 [Aureobasidium pullulans]
MAGRNVIAVAPILNPLFDDPVYAGYIPSNPRPDCALPADFLDMTPAQKRARLAEIANAQIDALAAERLAMLQGKSCIDDTHRDFLVALRRGDEYYAQQLIRRDLADNVTGSFIPTAAGLLTKSLAGVDRLTPLLAVIASMPNAVKQALVQGNFAELVMDPARIRNRTSIASIIPSPPTGGSTPVAQHNWEPLEYVTWLADRNGRHPNMAQMRAIIAKAKDYVSDINPGIRVRGTVAPYNKPNRRYRVSEAAMQPVFDIESQKQSRNGPSPHALTLTSYRAARNAQQTIFPALYAQTNSELTAIKLVITRTEEWLDQLVRDGWLPNSPMPLPRTLTSGGYAATPGPRQYQYNSHNNVGRNITIWDAIGSPIGFEQHWFSVFAFWDQRLASMSEHVITVQSFSYLNMSGLNSVAAGHNDNTSMKIPATTYATLKRLLGRTLNFTRNFNRLEARISKVNKNLILLPQVLPLLAGIKVKKEKVATYKDEEEKLKGDLAEKTKKCTQSWVDRVNECADYLAIHKAKILMQKRLRNLEREMMRALVDNNCTHISASTDTQTMAKLIDPTPSNSGGSFSSQTSTQRPRAVGLLKLAIGHSSRANSHGERSVPSSAQTTPKKLGHRPGKPIEILDDESDVGSGRG